jgi:hypothetical protein
MEVSRRERSKGSSAPTGVDEVDLVGEVSPVCVAFFLERVGVVVKPRLNTCRHCGWWVLHCDLGKACEHDAGKEGRRRRRNSANGAGGDSRELISRVCGRFLGGGMAG